MLKRVSKIWLCVIMLSIGCASGALASGGIEKITAYLSKDISFVVNDKAWVSEDSSGKKLYPITYNNTTYIPIRSVANALDVPVTWVGDSSTIYINSTVPAKKAEEKATTPTATLKTAKEIQDYIDKNYKNKSPLKTDLGDIPFTIDVLENTSKFEEYDILIEFNYKAREVSSLIFDAENSIKAAEQKKASNTKASIKKFVESYAKDVTSKTKGLKLRGETDASYYVYPNIQMDLIVSYKNVWVNYDFIDPNSIFADHFGPLTEYGDTTVSQYQWIGDGSY